MKQYSITVDKHQANWIFSPIRKRSDIIILLMKTIKVFLVNTPPATHQTGGKIVLRIAKMSRLFYASPEKVFSINFPFNVADESGSPNFYSSEGYEIDNKITSDVLEIINSGALISDSLYGFADPIMEFDELSPNIWRFFRELITMDDGYLRYDFDANNENGHLHPLNHIDVFYSSKTTFKIGLKRQINQDDLRDILDIESNCHYLHPSLP